jgi:O-antigen ligase
MDNIQLINIIIIFIGAIIFVISIMNYTYSIALWLVLFAIVGQIKGFHGWEIFPMERILNTLLFVVALIKLRGSWYKLPDASIFTYFLWFIIACLLSSLFSEMPLPSLGRSLTFLAPLMMGIMVLAAIIEKENGLQLIIRAMIVGFTIAIFYAIVEFILQKNYLADLGVLPWDEDYLSDIRFGISGRISSFIGQPVYTALYLLVMLPLILFYREYYVTDRTMKIIYIILVILGVMAIFMTGTRSVYLPLIILPLVYLFYRKGMAIFSSTLFYIYLVALVLLPFVLPGRLIEFTLESFRGSDSLNLAATSGLYGRLELTDFFWDLFREHIFLGFGPGYIQRMADSLAVFKNLAGMENQYAGLLVESGIIGFLVFMVFIIKVIKMSAVTCWDANLFISDWAVITSSIFTLVMLIAISVYIINGPIMYYLMVYLAILIGVKAQRAGPGADFEDPDRELPFSNDNKNGAPLLQGE